MAMQHITKNETRYNLIYWCTYFVLISFIESGPLQAYADAFSANFITLPVKIAFVVLVVEVLVPRFLLQKKVRVFLLLYFPLLVLFAVFLRILDNAFILKYILTHWGKQPLFYTPPFVYSLIKLQFVLAIPLGIKLFLHYVETKNRAMEISHKRVEAELNMLRSQFHPHFMFNALNSLYAKIISRSEESAEMVLKISSLLRFSIYEASARVVSLGKEIHYLQDYIALQRIRFGHTVDISFTVHGEINNHTIEPFLLMPFVENSFKYCQGEAGNAAWVIMQLSVEGDGLTFMVDNSKGKKAIPETREDGLYHGLGQMNAMKRLELLYSRNYTLKVSESEDNYIVYLQLKLNP